MSGAKNKESLIESLKRAIARADDFAVRVHYTLLTQQGMNEKEILKAVEKDETA